MVRKKSYLFVFILILFSSSLVYASFVFSKTSWQNTQNFSYEGGTGQERLVNQFTQNSSVCGGAGTMYDNITNLCWTQNSSTAMNFTNATAYCQGLATAGGNWRLPQKAELMTLLFHNGASTTYTKLNSIGFSQIQNNGYWTNTRYSPSPSTDAYRVDFDYSYSYAVGITSSHYVLCVKTAQ